MSIEAHAATAEGFPLGQPPLDVQGSTFVSARRRRNCSSIRAIASFVKGQIADARVEGSPASSNSKSEAPDRQVRGRAGVIEYDFTNGVVRLHGPGLVQQRQGRVSRRCGSLQRARRTRADQSRRRRRAASAASSGPLPRSGARRSFCEDRKAHRRRNATGMAHESSARRGTRQDNIVRARWSVIFRSRSRAAKSSVFSGPTAPAKRLRST